MADESIPTAEDVLTRLGFHQNPADKAQWKAPNLGIYMIRGETFIDSRGYKGRGALDLYSRITNATWSESTKFINEFHSPNPGSVQTTSHNDFVDLRSKALKIAEPDIAATRDLHDELVEDMKVSRRVLHKLAERGLLFADSWRTATFVARSAEGDVVGAELRRSRTDLSGKPKFALAYGMDRAKGCFAASLVHPQYARDNPILIVPNSMEALSLLTLKPYYTVVSLGDLLNHHLLNHLAPRLEASGRKIYSAMPATQSGQEAARVIFYRHNWRWVRPDLFIPEARTWGEALRKHVQLGRELHEDLKDLGQRDVLHPIPNPPLNDDLEALKNEHHQPNPV